MNDLPKQISFNMGRIDVEKAIEELTLGEKVALTAGMPLELLSEDSKT